MKNSLQTEKNKSMQEQQNGVWPPSPVSLPSEPNIQKSAHKNALLTNKVWIDALLGMPSGFIGTFLLYVLTGAAIQLIHPPPINTSIMYAISIVGIMMSAIICACVWFRYRIFGSTMIAGMVVMAFMLLFITWFAT